MRILLTLLPSAMLVATAAGCATERVAVIDRQSDWVKLGPDVRGHVYVWDEDIHDWSKASRRITLPEGWVAGPEPKE